MKRFIVFISVPLVFSCSKKMSCTEYVAYTQEQHDEFEVEMENNVTYTLTYVPVEKIIAENVLANDSLKQALKADLKVMNTRRSSSFQLAIGTKSGNLLTQHTAPKTEQAKYYSVDFKNDIAAINNSNDTIPCSGYLYQSNGGFGNQSYFEFDIALPLEEIKEVLITSKYLTDSAVSMNLSGLHHEYPKLKIK